MAFDTLANEALQPLPEMATDPVRAVIDDALRAALGTPGLAPLRALLAREPVICNASLGAEVPPEEQVDQFEFPGLFHVGG